MISIVSVRRTTVRNSIQTARLCVVIAVSALAPLAAVRAQDTALPDAETILDRFVEVTGGQAAYDDRPIAQ